VGGEPQESGGIRPEEIGLTEEDATQSEYGEGSLKPAGMVQSLKFIRLARVASITRQEKKK